MSSVASAPVDVQFDVIRSRPRRACCLCGSAGVSLYEGVIDKIFGAPGEWNFKRCSNPVCGLMWLDPAPLEEDIGKAYTSYYTHEDGPAPNSNFLRSVYCGVRKSYLHSRYDHRSIHGTRGEWLSKLMYLNPLRRNTLDLSVFWLRSKPYGRLLELGCGSGQTLGRMHELGWQVEGLDFDPSAVEQSRRKGLTVHLGTLAEQNIPDNTFDAVVGNHFIEHVPDPVDVLRECRRLLKAEGLLV